MFVEGVYHGFTALFAPFVLGALPLLFFLFGRIRTTSKGHRFKLIFLVLLVLLFNQALLVFPTEMISLRFPGKINLISILLLLIFGLWYIIDLIKPLPIVKNVFSMLGVLLSALWLFTWSAASSIPLLLPFEGLDNYESSTNTITMLGFGIGLCMPIVLILWFADRIYKKMIFNPYWRRTQLLVGGVLIVIAVRQIGNIFITSSTL